MFGGIASRYDLMNRLMTFGLDQPWRRLAARQTGLTAGDLALDVCCGTGDLAFTVADLCPGCRVVGLDFTEAMLESARRKAAARQRRGLGEQPEFVLGDLLSLPFDDGAFAAVSVGFGVRNVPDVELAFAEMRRVARPGGHVVCLEATQMAGGPAKPFHDLWFDRAVPLLGALVAGDAAAYSYLPASVRAFPRARELAELMTAVGLVAVRYRLLGFGAVALHVGEVPAAAGDS
jgi:demethylmenaquinone methyltransferase / 2-methoxy-6-polyprenyl-1,4-benzoquinol methylase